MLSWDESTFCRIDETNSAPELASEKGDKLLEVKLGVDSQDDAVRRRKF